ncbi:hypothetical protein [Methanobrevibacter sp.]|uniref:hypothetical protein n=1 Tax=Methanobrevibacter sp. TaxID=66852 RepID=UPI0026E095E1|nr:hypothetical protein [Methanobrevibacter sp.]MDO5823824.1 hypothetical protein [Methanobrevibacter sp.]
MNDKNIIIILIIVAIIAVAGFIFAFGLFDGNENMETTPFKTDFMEGSFVGNVTLENDKEKFMHSYEDKKHKITYNISTIDNSSALMEIYELQGVTNPEQRNFNGNDWNIYFTKAVPTTNSTNNSDDNSDNNNSMNIIICESQAKKQGYLIYIIIDGSSDINSTNIYGESYTDYVEPLLKSIVLKESKNVPRIHEEFGLTKEQFKHQIELVREYKSGNASALQGNQ